MKPLSASVFYRDGQLYAEVQSGPYRRKVAVHHLRDIISLMSHDPARESTDATLAAQASNHQFNLTLADAMARHRQFSPRTMGNRPPTASTSPRNPKPKLSARTAIALGL